MAKQLKNFISAEQAIGRVVTKITFTPKLSLNEYHDGRLDSASVAVHFDNDDVTVFSFGEDWSGCYYQGDMPKLHGVNIEDEGELADAKLSADELELWKESEARDD